MFRPNSSSEYDVNDNGNAAVAQLLEVHCMHVAIISYYYYYYYCIVRKFVGKSSVIHQSKNVL